MNTLGLANTVVLNYLAVRIPCLGHRSNAVAGVSGIGTPVNTYNRISSIGNNSATALYGPFSQGGTIRLNQDWGAEPPVNALYNRLQVSTTISGKQAKGSRTFFLHGVPDTMINDEVYVGNAGAGTQDFDSAIQAYYAYLVGNPLLCIAAQDPTSPSGSITGGSIVANQWQLTATNVGMGSPLLAAGDRIYLKGVNPNTFDGSWAVAAVSTGSPNTITLGNGPPSGTPNPTQGTWQKTYDVATKSLMKVLIPFNLNANWLQLPGAGAIYQVRSHKVGRPFSAFRSTKKHKRARLN